MNDNTVILNDEQKFTITNALIDFMQHVKAYEPTEEEMYLYNQGVEALNVLGVKDYEIYTEAEIEEARF